MNHLFISLNTPCGDKYAQFDIFTDLRELTRQEFVNLCAILRVLEENETFAELKTLAENPEVTRN